MLKAAEIFQSGMLLQQKKPVSVWGCAEAGQPVEVSVQGVTGSSAADDGGRWEVILPPLEASRGEQLCIVSGGDRLTFTDVAIGEVWIAGGQSNMEFAMRYEKHKKEVLDDCADADIRFFDVPEIAFDGQRDCFDYSRMGVWRKAGPEDLDYFSAVGYYFQTALKHNLDIPVGIVGCNWGGTVSASWMNPQTVRDTAPEWVRDYDAFREKTDWDSYIQRQRESMMNNRGNLFADPFCEFIMPGTPSPEECGAFFASLAAAGALPEFSMEDFPVQNIPGVLYEHMVKTIVPFTVRGVLWYQGESDDELGHAGLYESMLTALINDWRALWGEELPFLIVQLPGFERWLQVENKAFDEIRDAQERVCRKAENTWLCSISDVGERFDIHPKNKKAVGERLALLARGHVYGQDILCDAPAAGDIQVDNDRIRILFTHAEDGLELKGEDVQALKVRLNGKEAAYTSEIVGNQLILTLCDPVRGTVQVDFAKEKFYLVNLYNKAGIPAIPFSLTVRAGE